MTDIELTNIQKNQITHLNQSMQYIQLIITNKKTKFFVSFQKSKSIMTTLKKFQVINIQFTSIQFVSYKKSISNSVIFINFILK